MKFFSRLRVCFQLLRARRAVVLIPEYPTLHMAVVGTLPPAAWEAIVCYAMREHGEAVEQANIRLLTDMALLSDEETQNALLAEARHLLAPKA